jgi:hypothetical protein
VPLTSHWKQISQVGWYHSNNQNATFKLHATCTTLSQAHATQIMHPRAASVWTQQLTGDWGFEFFAVTFDVTLRDSIVCIQRKEC